MTTEYTIDELAREASATVRNIRAYQERGILPPPVRRGRVGVYDDTHLARLRVIGSMLARGYTIANVAELIEAWESGVGVGAVIGLEAAVTSSWTDEEPTHLTMAQALALFDTEPSPEVLARAVELDVVRPVEDGFVVPSMKLLTVAAELMREGVGLADLLAMIAELRTTSEEIADRLVRLVVSHVFDRYGKDSLPPSEEAPRLAALIWRLRPMVLEAVDAEVARAMGAAARAHLGERLAHVLEHMRESRPPS